MTSAGAPSRVVSRYEMALVARAASVAMAGGMTATRFPVASVSDTTPPDVSAGRSPVNRSGSSQLDAARAECRTSDVLAPGRGRRRHQVGGGQHPAVGHRRAADSGLDRGGPRKPNRRGDMPAKPHRHQVSGGGRASDADLDRVRALPPPAAGRTDERRVDRHPVTRRCLIVDGRRRQHPGDRPVRVPVVVRRCVGLVGDPDAGVRAVSGDRPSARSPLHLGLERRVRRQAVGRRPRSVPVAAVGAGRRGRNLMRVSRRRP